MRLGKEFSNSLRTVGLATLGQGLNFLAMMMPVFGHQAGQIAVLLFPLSLAAISFRLGTVGFQVRYLTVSNGEKDMSIAVSFILLLATSILLVALAAGAHVVFPQAGDILFFASLLCFTHGIYYMGVTVLIEEKKDTAYGRGRFFYGVLNLISTSIVVFVFPFREGLILATMLVTLSAGCWMLTAADATVFGAVRSSRARISRAIGPYIRDSRVVVGSLLVSEAGFQVQGLVTPLMGPLQELWAVVARLSGGFGTVGHQVLAPLFEMRVAEEMRNRRLKSAHRWAVTGQSLSLAFALIASIVQSLVVYFFLGRNGYSFNELVLTAVYTFALLSNSACSKIPYLLKHDQWMMRWALLRLALTAPLFLLSGANLLLAITVLQLGVSALLILLTVLSPSASKNDR